VREQRWELPDGDFLDLAWSGIGSGDDVQPPGTSDQRPIAILLHGLEGDRSSNYIIGLTHALQQRGWRSCLMHFRNCGGEPNRLARSYHSGETTDIQRLVERLRNDHPDAPLVVVGYSLGGNVLLKWLGEQGADAAVDAAVAVSVPMRLDLCADRMETGLSRLYQHHLVKKLQHSSRRKFGPRGDSPYPLERLHELRSFRQFDHEFTAPLHGFASGADYYQRSSSRQFLRGIEVPTLIIHARDDPFMTPGVIPEESELAPSVTLELSDHGGHVGFISGHWPWRLHYWLDQRIPEFLAEQLGNP
jgi:predicted alpha/beta-fold hydrolase